MKACICKLLFLGLIVGGLLLQACGPAGLYKPSGMGPFPAVIVLHGKGGLQQHHLDFADNLSSEGYVTLAIDYLSGPPGPDPEVIKEELQLIVDAYDQLKALPIVDSNRIGMVGFSRGSNRALIFAATYPERKIRGIVNYYAGCFGCGNIYTTAKFPANLFLHGQLDGRTSPESIKIYCEGLRLRGSDCEVHIYKGVAHAFDSYSPRYVYDSFTTADAFKRAVAFLDKHVKSKSK